MCEHTKTGEHDYQHTGQTKELTELQTGKTTLTLWKIPIPFISAWDTIQPATYRWDTIHYWKCPCGATKTTRDKGTEKTETQYSRYINYGDWEEV